MKSVKKKIIPIFVPHQGCPHDCIFCNQKKITGVSTDVTEETVESVINECLEYIDRDASIEIAFFGGSFTAIDIDIQRKLLSVAKKYIDSGDVDYIRLSTRPDCIDEEILAMLKEYGVRIIELGVQSLDEKVLVDSVRGHGVDVVYKSAEMIRNAGFELGLQMMVGLPSDTEEKCIATAKAFIGMKPSCVRIYPTLVVEDTGLEKELNEGSYTPFSLEESRNIVKKLLVLYKLNEINVIRVGLQATDDIQIGEGVVDGPYHPAFRELVESDMIRDYLEYFYMERHKIEVKIEVGVNRKNVSKIIGNRKANVKYFADKYNIKLMVHEMDMELDDIKLSFDDLFSQVITLEEIYKALFNIYKL
ncbi:MAG: radical SAM protein [Clostridioides sp.]|jgi:histone acetyltransferase (RNA polymerase elongator complex component)|nr:radical SAM protein [Clostridioides sp.]